MVWSKAKGCYVVVSELAKQNGKNKYGQTGEATGLLSALLCALMLTGSALFWPMEVSPAHSMEMVPGQMDIIQRLV